MKAPTIFILIVAFLAITMIISKTTWKIGEKYRSIHSIQTKLDSLNSSVSPLILSSIKPVEDDWELIGDKGGCKLYTKVIYFHRVYWSICTSNMSSSSITIH